MVVPWSDRPGPVVGVVTVGRWRPWLAVGVVALCGLAFVVGALLGVLFG
jgi:hypothetical protein